ncbi:hypothetical protein PM082_017215 [Marasmius tenuissimus]|nr:hypothetical protein PM082_017215 [Marasmius tenuissimus]
MTGLSGLALWERVPILSLVWFEPLVQERKIITKQTAFSQMLSATDMNTSHHGASLSPPTTSLLRMPEEGTEK